MIKSAEVWQKGCHHLQEVHRDQAQGPQLQLMLKYAIPRLPLKHYVGWGLVKNVL